MNRPTSQDCPSSISNQFLSNHLTGHQEVIPFNRPTSQDCQSSISNQYLSNHLTGQQEVILLNRPTSQDCLSSISNQFLSNHLTGQQEVIPLNRPTSQDCLSSISNKFSSNHLLSLNRPIPQDHSSSNSLPNQEFFLSNHRIGYVTSSSKPVLCQDISSSIQSATCQDSPSSNYLLPQDVILSSSQMNQHQFSPSSNNVSPPNCILTSLQTNQTSPLSNHNHSQIYESDDESDDESVSQSDNDESINTNSIGENIDNTQQHQHTDNTNNEDEIFDNRCCDNCQRRQSAVLCNENDVHSPYTLSFIETTTLYVHCRRKFKFVPSTQNEDNASALILCEQCHNHLITDNMEVAKDIKNCWPGFIWGILSDENIQRVYGDVIWRFLPHQWRLWWLDSSHFSIPSLLNVTLDHPSSFIVDITIKIQQWNLDYQSKMLPRLANTCNKYLMPNILCPWGCSEYLHK